MSNMRIGGMRPPEALEAASDEAADAAASATSAAAAGAAATGRSDAAGSASRMSVLAGLAAGSTAPAGPAAPAAPRAPEPGAIGSPEAIRAIEDLPAKPLEEEYDYVIIGSGAGGSPLAARLAEQGYKVLVLEAGGTGKDTKTDDVPAFHAKASEDPKISTPFFVSHYGDGDRQKRDPNYRPNEGGVLYPRGQGLGGSTTVNAMITVAPHPSDFNRIAELTGDASWKSERMEKYMARVENNEHRPVLGAIYDVADKLGLDRLKGWVEEKSGHGFSGWLTTTLPDPKLALSDKGILSIVKAAAAEAYEGQPPLDFARRLTNLLDPNDRDERTAEGLTLTPLAITKDGRRDGPRERLLEVQEKHPDRLAIRTGALADKITFDGNRATGVEFLEGPGLWGDPAKGGMEKRVVRARREVIVSAGTFNSPQILKRSGIGPEEELKAKGIAPRVDLPGVGKNLQDRYEVAIVSDMKQDFTILEGAQFLTDPSDPVYKKWLEGLGPYATNGSVVAYTKRSHPDLPEPDLYIFGVAGNFQGYKPGYSEEVAARSDLFTWVVLKAHTDNDAGTVDMKTRDPRDKPAINFRYFDEGSDADGSDLAGVVEGVMTARRIMDRLGDKVEGEMYPGREIDTKEEIEEYVKSTSWGHHASGTVKIGADDDPTAVLDSKFRVRGTEGLRVVDGSVFPEIPGFFVALPTYMISEKAADSIVDDAKAADRAAGRPR